jgi:hypothetical protein
MSNFECFWICNKEEAIFQKKAKTFGSPFTHAESSDSIGF